MSKTNSNKMTKNNGKQTHSTRAGQALVRRENLLKDRLGEQVCAMNDPFCPRANGARWSTVGSTPTVTYQYRGIVTLTPASDSAGWAAMAFCPSNSKNFYSTTDLSLAGLSWAVPANLNAGDTALSAYMDACDEVRVVSAGLKWWDVSPKTGAGGTVVCQEYSSYDDIGGTTVNVAALTAAPVTDAIDRRNPQGGCWIQRPTDFNAYEFRAPVTNNNDTDNNNARSALIIGVSGELNTPLITVEMVINYEGVPAAASALLRLGKAQRDSALTRAAVQLSDGVWSSIQTIRKGATASISAYIKNYAKRAIGGYLTGGSMGAVAGLLTDAYDVD